MKKTFRRTDGTEVTVEGTPEELAQYEQKINEGSPAPAGKKRPPVLKGSEIDWEKLGQLLQSFGSSFEDIIKRLAEIQLKPPAQTIFIEKIVKPAPAEPIWPNPWEPHRPYIWYSDRTSTVTPIDIRLIDGKPSD